MVTQLQPDVRAYLHGGEVIKRYIKVEEVAYEYGFSVEETEYIASVKRYSGTVDIEVTGHNFVIDIILENMTPLEKTQRIWRKD